MNKEQVYGEKIFPLMAQIIDICREHKIAHVCHFDIPTPEDDGLCVTTGNIEKEREPSESLEQAFGILKPGRRPIFMAFTIKKTD